MRVVTLVVLSCAGLISGEALALDWNTLMATNRQARWNACYKETRLMHRTRNMSGQDYRAMIKDARRVHMQDCMTRADPPSPTAIPEIDEKMPPSSIAGWSRNP